MTLAVVMSRFPKLTETFVLEEVEALERSGASVVLYPLRREHATVTHPAAARWVTAARFVPFLSWPVVRSNAWFLRHHPRRYLGAIAAALAGAWGSLRFFAGALAIFPKTAHAARLMDAEGVTHVHCHFATHPALAGFVVHRLTGIPYSFTAHGSDLHKDRHMLPQKAGEAAFVATVSAYNRRIIAAECAPEVDARLHVVRCGVDTQRFTPRPRAAPATGPLRLVSVGTLHDVKGHRYLIDALARAVVGGVAVRCDVIGDGPDRAALEQQVCAAGLDGAVTFLGPRPAEEVAAALQQADVLVAPSVPTPSGRREGIPVVLMEAMACGLPVIASRLSGIPELVDDGVEGILVAPTDVEGLTAAIKRLAADERLRQEMGAAGRARVQRDHDVDVNAARLRRLIEGVAR